MVRGSKDLVAEPARGSVDSNVYHSTTGACVKEAKRNGLKGDSSARHSTAKDCNRTTWSRIIDCYLLSQRKCLELCLVLCLSGTRARHGKARRSSGTRHQPLPLRPKFNFPPNLFFNPSSPRLVSSPFTQTSHFYRSFKTP